MVRGIVQRVPVGNPRYVRKRTRRLIKLLLIERATSKALCMRVKTLGAAVVNFRHLADNALSDDK
eukprot:2964728-Pyramimonas_sp.AAC.1